MLDFRTFSNISMQLNPDLCIDLLINKIEYNKKKKKTQHWRSVSSPHSAGRNLGPTLWRILGRFSFLVSVSPLNAPLSSRVSAAHACQFLFLCAASRTWQTWRRWTETNSAKSELIRFFFRIFTALYLYRFCHIVQDFFLSTVMAVPVWHRKTSGQSVKT